MSSEFYGFAARNIQGGIQKMAEYEGKILLIVNTASKCRFTPQYEGLEKLYGKFNGKGLRVLGFPCNQFGSQEPGSESEILSTCQVNYGVTFPMFAKVDVNGPKAHPIFTFLKSKKKGILGRKIKWNFTKFLITPEGEVIKRYSPTVSPEKIGKDLIKFFPELSR